MLCRPSRDLCQFSKSSSFTKVSASTCTSSINGSYSSPTSCTSLSLLLYTVVDPAHCHWSCSLSSSCSISTVYLPIRIWISQHFWWDSWILNEIHIFYFHSVLSCRLSDWSNPWNIRLIQYGIADLEKQSSNAPFLKSEGVHVHFPLCPPSPLPLLKHWLTRYFLDSVFSNGTLAIWTLPEIDSKWM